MEKISAVLLLACLSLPVHAREKTPGALFQEANASFQKGDVAAARNAYERLVKDGWGSDALYYDLGNACYRMGETGRARLWYERALAQDPRDDDARYNRDIVLARLGLQEEPISPAASWFTTLSWTFAGLNVLFFALLAAGLFRRDEALWWAKRGAGLMLAAAGAALVPARSQALQRWAVVTAPRAEARSAPSEGAAVGFVAPQGERVALFQTDGGWAEVGVPSQGLKGWTKTSDVEAVDLP